MRTLCKHILASAERKFNTVIPSLGDTILIRIYTDARECFKNIKWRDVDKKIRLLEFYVFGNVAVRQYQSKSLQKVKVYACGDVGNPHSKYSTYAMHNIDVGLEFIVLIFCV